MSDDDALRDDELWLTGGGADTYLADAATHPNDELALIARLRKTLSPERARLVVEQAALRRKAGEKFAAADRLFFTPVGLEQATDAATAVHKAARYAADARIVDFCCGIGGDLFALGRRGIAVGIDRSAGVARRAAANCRVWQSLHEGAFRATAIEAEATPQRAADCDAWHIDPDRRPDGRRTTRVELHEPGLDALESLLVANPHGAVKLSPAAEVPDAWRDRAECEWISRRGECKQLVAWFGKLTSSPGLRKATALTDDGQAQSLVGTGGIAPPDVPEFGRYLHEPDAAVLAADLLGEFAAQYQIAAVHPGAVYFTGDVRHDDALIASYEIVETMPFDQKRLRAWLAQRNVGRLEIKKRSVDVDVAKLRRDLRLRGDEAASLILVRRGDRVTAVLTRNAK